ncbi:MAG: PQQ-binding-like beta-propeller repeat protein [Lachnospiraceae bacterium]|nr:PQQ-binding-like beta-propeller repeat protein [Lachnospiraceae bacterium]
MSQREGSFLKRNLKKIVILACIAVVLIAGFLGFKFLVKVGSIKYIYNYMNDTAGELELISNPEGAKGANAKKPSATDDTKPSLYGIEESIYSDGQKVGSFKRKNKIDFSDAFVGSFADGIGMTTFRGDYHRNLSSMGVADIVKESFGRETWEYTTGKVLKSNGVDYWSGNGWTGQPVVVRWDERTKRNMNLYDEAKDNPGLVEVIYPGMDGWIHFVDLETGEETRPQINVGMTFKGSASLYPGGVPLLFCGSGDAQTGPFGENVCQRFYIYSLIDGSLLFEYGFNDEKAPRIWHAYDSSPLIDPGSDTLIYPGENGVIYTMKLNTSYDEREGTVSVAPSDFVDYTFTSERYSEDGHLWGSESSASAWKGYVFVGDNSGLLYCLDLNSMKMVWAQDLREDINSSVIFDEDESGNRFLYAATTLKYNYGEHFTGTASIFKINAMTGEIVWEKPYEVHTVKGLAGGVLSTGVAGKGSLSDYLFYSVSKTPELDGGYIVALSKKTGEEIWKIDLDMYSWSSTALVTAESGKAYLIQGCQNGDLLLIDAVEGKVLDRRNFGTGIEATPVVIGNRIVFGTRSEKIIGLAIE